MTCGDLLIRLGITPNYVGFHQTRSAVELARRQPDQLFLVTKQIYPEVAKQCRTSWKAVERNIRSAASMAWEKNPELLQEMAGHTLESRPTAAQFLAILAYREP